jgi:chaperone modulatory protein CbpM
MTDARRTRIESVEIVGETLTFDLREVCVRCGLRERDVVGLVHQGVLTPQVESVDAERDWQFAASELPLLARAARLQRSFDLDSAGLALAIELIDQLENARREIDRLRQLLDQHGLD